MSDIAAQLNAEIAGGAKRRSIVYRHSAIVRVTHWVAVLCVMILLMSGLQIFNAHPALYSGPVSDFVHRVVSIGPENTGDHVIGVTTVFGHTFNTTGVLGVSGKSDKDQQAFPAWATLPGYQDLATGRRGHFFFAWLLVVDGLVYLIYGLAGGHVWCDLIPSPRQLGGIGTSILDHLKLRFPRGEEARRYNILQRLSYVLILFFVFPVLILAGLAMSPGLDAAFPILTAIFGGRQSARTIHFICASLVLAFAMVHVTMVVLSGPWNNMRSMISGWYTLQLKTD